MRLMGEIRALFAEHSKHLSHECYRRFIKEVYKELRVESGEANSAWSTIQQHDDTDLTTMLEESIRPSLTRAFSNSSVLRDLEITLQTIILLRALTRNNSLFSQYVYELEASLFENLKTDCPSQSFDVLKYDIKSYDVK